jgi:RNA polymerase sigma factor (sigma-70 family)
MDGMRIDDRTVRDVWVKYKRTRRKVYKNKLIETYLPLVRNVAERMLMTLPASVELDDLISMGTFGLIEAIQRFDIDRGVLFKTYCVNRIRGAILDELRALDWVWCATSHPPWTRSGGACSRSWAARRPCGRWRTSWRSRSRTTSASRRTPSPSPC